MPTLPISTVLPELKSCLINENNVVLVAAPGAGKTTVVPLALLNESWLDNRKIIMLEPRRIAAKNAAIWMARQLGEVVGETVGYRMRLDTQVSKKTKIEVVTEGILTRIIQNDIALDDYGIIIFDEFHERSLHADLGLALTLNIQEELRNSLRILVMSATLDSQIVSALLDNAPVIKSEGRHFPIDIRYANNPTGYHSDNRKFRQLEKNTVESVLTALVNDKGSILVFLPGVGEIRRVYDLLKIEINSANLACADISLYPLYSSLPQSDQEKAIASCTSGNRKIVLATSIAETSLTIDGVCVVIDAGLVRQPGFDPRNGLTQLETVRVSKASADQRAGRAGRTEPGICYRLWAASEHTGLIAQNQVEIMQADLSSFALELAQWGIAQPEKLRWIDTPPAAAFTQATTLLKTLGAINQKGAITEQGMAMLKLGLHPRLAHMVLKANALALGELACDIASVLNERDFFLRTHGIFNGDLSARIISLRQTKSPVQQSNSLQNTIDYPTKKRILNNARLLKKQLGISADKNQTLDLLGVVLAFAYPDRIAKKRLNSNDRYQLSNGLGAQVNIEDVLSSSEYLVAANIRKTNGSNQYNEARVYLGADITLQQIESYLSELIVNVEKIEWDSTARSVITKNVSCLGKLTLNSRKLSNPDEAKVTAAFIEGIREMGVACLPWNQSTRLWQQRLDLLRQTRTNENWPDVSDAFLFQHLEDWLSPYLSGFSRLDQLRNLNLASIFNGMLEWNKQQLMNQLVPEVLKVPSGSRITIDYQDREAPVLAVRIQELFGLEESPTINEGKTKLVLHLLSPARRPIQVTKDLDNFWDNTYAEVKKDLKGRYPKHFWPDNPREAVATSRTKKFMR